MNGDASLRRAMVLGLETLFAEEYSVTLVVADLG